MKEVKYVKPEFDLIEIVDDIVLDSLCKEDTLCTIDTICKTDWM